MILVSTFLDMNMDEYAGSCLEFIWVLHGLQDPFLSVWFLDRWKPSLSKLSNQSEASQHTWKTIAFIDIHHTLWYDLTQRITKAAVLRNAKHTHTSRATWPKRHTSRSTAPTSNDWMCLALARYHCRKMIFLQRRLNTCLDRGLQMKAVRRGAQCNRSTVSV